MKKEIDMKKILFCLLALTTAFFFSCSDISQDDGGHKSADGGTYLVIRSASVKRTLRPSKDENDISFFTNFLLKGSRIQDSKGVELNESEIELAKADSLEELTKQQIPIQTGKWSLTLSADFNSITFSSSVEKSIEESVNNSVSFELKAPESYGGGLSVTVNFSDSSQNVSSVKVTLSAKDSDSTFTTEEKTFSDFTFAENDEGKPSASITFNHDLADENDRIPSGTYDLIFEFIVEDYGVIDPIPYIVRIADGFTTKSNQTIKLNETYSITYNDNEGELASGEKKALKYSSKSESIVLPKMEKDGYVFAGWFEDEKFTQPISQIEQGSRGDKNIYAAYINSVTVSANGSANADIVTGQPVDSINTAVSKIVEFGAPIDWTIFVDGKLECAQEIGQELTPSNAKSLTIEGLHENTMPDSTSTSGTDGYTDIIVYKALSPEIETENNENSAFYIATSAPVIIKNIEITGADEAGMGGGICMATHLVNVTLEAGTWITGNSASMYGGGVMINGTLTMKEGAVISDNRCEVEGGGVYIGSPSAKLYMEGGEISGNFAPAGSGVYVSNTASLTMSGTAYIASDNDVKLEVTDAGVLVGDLSENTHEIVATVTPAAYEVGNSVLSPAEDLSLTEEIISKFSIVQPTSGTDRYEIDLEGKLAPKKAATSGSVTTDNRVLNISLNTTEMYKNTILRFSVTDAWGNDVTDTVTFDAELLYQGKDVNTLAKEGTAYYTVDGSSGTLTLIQDNPLPKEGSYQLYVKASQRLNENTETLITSSQTFDVSFINEIVTPTTQAALYEYFSTDSYPNSYSYYLTDSSKVENAALATSSFEGNTTKTTFDVYGYFYILSDESSDPLLRSNNPIIAQQTEGGVILSEINYELSEGKPCNFTVDMANNKAYAWSGNYTNKTILYRYPNIFTSGSASDCETINLTVNGFIANNVVIYNDIVYVIGYDSTSDTCRILTYDISDLTFTDGEATATEAISTYDLSAYFTDKMTAQWQITDAYALEGALYFLVYDSSLYDSSYSMSSAWSTAGGSIYERGAIVKYLPPLNGATESIKYIGLKSDLAYANTAISQLLFYESSYGPVHTTEDLTSPVVTIIGSEKVNANSERLCNYYFPNIYGVGNSSDEYFAHPSKFIAVKPKKLVIADDGIAFYSDADGLSYKNADRVITVDLQDFVIESVQTSSAKFSEKVSGYFRTNSQLRLRNIISDNDGYYDSDKTCYYYDGSAASIVGKNLSEADLTLAFGSSDE